MRPVGAHGASVAASCVAMLRTLVASTFACIAPAPSAQAQPYPSKPVTVVVPFPAGAGPDLLARVLAEKLSPRFGQPVIVDNRPGVGGLAGANVVAKAAPDGHTLLVTPNTVVIAPHVLAKGAGGGVDVTRDLAPVVMPGITPMVLVVNPQLGVKTTAELIALAKKQPGLPYGSAGNGSPMHIAGELFKRSAGVDMLHVPFKGAQPAVTQTLGGEVKVLYMGLGAVLQHVRSGKLAVLGVAERARTSLLPGVQTLAEQGVRDVEVNAWYGVFAPAGTPQPVVDRLNREINAALKLPDVVERLASAGIEVSGGTAEALAREATADFTRYGRIVKTFGIEAD